MITPLHFAAMLNLDQIGKELIKTININAYDCNGLTPLMYAILADSHEFVHFLFNEPETNLNIFDIFFIIYIYFVLFLIF